ncbi:inositol monophosphatase family protein [Chitiniphilus eburneus]|uniref:Inositol monophosphatase family protein n=1 Tax=Chitiniphilus eburneus TaxID=2571148 RepID=A0A4V5MQQ6_9NEIS|nr:inositol monophosphatase family protein [Chitiniphilus eburneus]TJZ73498.1 inositol monophosphatase family protein [Chitiniphilus eburneus]
MSSPFPDQIELMRRLAQASGDVIRRYYRSELAIDDKDDASPVTRADREAEQAMRALIQAARPQDGIIGEEFGSENEQAEWVWVLDPVDGTKSFTVGRPLFVTLIGLLHRGVPVLGAVHQPITGDFWIGGTTLPTTLNGAPVRGSAIDELARARIGTTGPEYLSAGRAVFDDLAARCRYPIYGGDGFLYAQVASGWLELVIEEGLKLHDFAALAPLVNAAGGRMTDWQGEPLTQTSAGRVLAAGNPALHALALPALRALPV